MRTATPTIHRGLSLLAAAALVLALAPSASAQSELMVMPGVGTLNDAIEGDTGRPADRVYVLQRGAYYGITREIDTAGYTFRLKAADDDPMTSDDDNRPVVYRGTDATGTDIGSRYFNFGGDTYLTDIYFLGVSASQGEAGIPYVLNGEGMRFVVENCVFQGGRSRVLEVNAPDTDIFINKSQFRNLYRETDTSNARPIDYRDVPGDSLVVTNTSFIGVNGYLVRFEGTVLNTAIFDHVTVFATQRELTTNAFATQVINYRFTNSLIVNAYGEGQAPEEPNPDGTVPLADGVIRVDSLDADIMNGFTEADRSFDIRQNGRVISPALQDYYDARTTAGDPLESYTLIDDAVFAYADANPATIRLEENVDYDLTFTAAPDLTDFVQYLADLRDGSSAPAVWYFNQPNDQLFPATQPPPEDFSYATTEPAYTAGQGGLPLGDLTYFPDALEIYENAPNGGLAVNTPDEPAFYGFTIRSTFPNPAAERATIRFGLDAPATVEVALFDALGRRVLAAPAQSYGVGGDHRVALDTADLPTGLYLVRATATGSGDVQTQTTQFTVVR